MKNNPDNKRNLSRKSKAEGGKKKKSITLTDKVESIRDGEFPGYPQYPAQEDIMNPGNGIAREELAETISKLVKTNSKTGAKALRNETLNQFLPVEQGEEADVSALTESDVTNEELNLIGSDELNSDMGEDEDLKKRTFEVDMAGQDLDIPGSDPESENENTDEEDEENNLYSIGGDRHDDLDEDKELGR